MVPLTLALQRAQGQLLARLAELEARLAAGDEAAWAPYLATATALATIGPALAPGAGGQLLTTQELAERLQLSPRTVRRRAKAGQLEPVRLGKRGRGALRWNGEAGR